MRRCSAAHERLAEVCLDVRQAIVAERWRDVCLRERARGVVDHAAVTPEAQARIAASDAASPVASTRSNSTNVSSPWPRTTKST